MSSNYIWNHLKFLNQFTPRPLLWPGPTCRSPPSPLFLQSLTPCLPLPLSHHSQSSGSHHLHSAAGTPPILPPCGRPWASPLPSTMPLQQALKKRWSPPHPLSLSPSPVWLLLKQTALSPPPPCRSVVCLPPTPERRRNPQFSSQRCRRTPLSGELTLRQPLFPIPRYLTSYLTPLCCRIGCRLPPFIEEHRCAKRTLLLAVTLLLWWATAAASLPGVFPSSPWCSPWRPNVDRAATASPAAVPQRRASASWPCWHGPAEPLWLLNWANSDKPWAECQAGTMCRFILFFGIDLNSRNSIKLPKFIENHSNLLNLQCKFWMNPLEQI
jgi:hypothetical protein